MTDCLFENQEDDATNIHGLYAQVSRKISPTELELRLVHPQQIGFELVARGDSIELVHGSSLVTYGQAKVKSATRLNAEYTRVTLSEPAPEELKSGDVVASLGDYPDVLIRHCTLGKNRARGFLLGSRGKIVVEDCTFHTPGAAILFEGDGRFWFEQAGVRDLASSATIPSTTAITGHGEMRPSKSAAASNRPTVPAAATTKTSGSREIRSACSIRGSSISIRSITSSSATTASFPPPTTRPSTPARNRSTLPSPITSCSRARMKRWRLSPPEIRPKRSHSLMGNPRVPRGDSLSRPGRTVRTTPFGQHRTWGPSLFLFRCRTGATRSLDVQSRREVVLGAKLCQNRRTYGTSITRVRPHDGGSASGDPI